MSPANSESLLKECCELLRTGRQAEASISLNAWLGQLDSTLRHRPLPDEVSSALAVAFEAQRRGDLITLADQLEYVIGPGLQGSDQHRSTFR